ncbi:MAG: outer membrane beta-barrel protein [Alphaproteobacteria bacterium]|nr:outer membrane beta-barrel protein [Alphaproteobacteria bacterium]
MKKLLLTSAIVALGQTATTAQAQSISNSYIAAKIGFTKTSDSDWSDTGLTGDIGIDTGANFALAYGFNLIPSLRTEFEVSYRKADLDDITVDGVGTADLTGDVKTWGFLLNGYYDFMADQAVSPYITAGIGALRHSGKIASVAGLGVTGASDSDTVFAYQLGGGASYDLSDNVALDGGYRYLASSDPDFDGLEAEYGAHEFRIGLRYGF